MPVCGGPRPRVQPSIMGAMYIVDELDRPVELEGLPLLDPGDRSPLEVYRNYESALPKRCFRPTSGRSGRGREPCQVLSDRS